MTLRKAQRFAAAAALAGILFLAAAPVQARDLGPAPRTWQWIQDLWRGISFFWSWTDRDSPGDFQKEGPGSDPNGASSTGSAASPEGNSGITASPTDPNG